MRQRSEFAARAALHAYARSLEGRLSDLREWLTKRRGRRAALCLPVSPGVGSASGAELDILHHSQAPLVLRVHNMLALPRFNVEYRIYVMDNGAANGNLQQEAKSSCRAQMRRM